MINKLTDYDRKKIDLVLKNIDSFLSGNIKTYNLHTELTGVLNSLEGVEESWKDVFRRCLNRIELVYESENDGSIVLWKENPQRVLSDAVSIIREMSVKILEKYLSNPDFEIRTTAKKLEGGWLLCPNCSDAWQCSARSAMVVCPHCDTAMHNPCYK